MNVNHQPPDQEDPRDDDQLQEAEPPKPIIEQLWNAARKIPTPTALHITRPEYDELRNDPRAMEYLDRTSDGAFFHGIALGIEGGADDLPAPEPPCPQDLETQPGAGE